MTVDPNQWRKIARTQLIEATRCLDAAQNTIANAADHEPVPFEAGDAIEAARQQIRTAMDAIV